MDELASLASFARSYEASTSAADADCDSDGSDGEPLDFDEEGEQSVASPSIIPQGGAKGKCLYMPLHAGAVYSEVFHTPESSINAESGSLGMRMDRCDAESSLPPPAVNDFV